MDVRVQLRNGNEFFVRNCTGFGSPQNAPDWIKFWSAPRGKDKQKVCLAMVRTDEMLFAVEVKVTDTTEHSPWHGTIEVG